MEEVRGSNPLSSTSISRSAQALRAGSESPLRISERHTSGKTFKGGGVNRSEWVKGRTEARIWWCGDYECDCIQPRIERVTPNREAGYPWIRRETLWEGTFVSTGQDSSGYPDGVTYESLIEELREASKAYGDGVWLVAK